MSAESICQTSSHDGASGCGAEGHRQAEICPVLYRILNGDFANVLDRACCHECQVYHKSSYLEHCLSARQVPESIEQFMADDSSYVRRLAQRIAIEQRLPLRSMACDPTHEIRAAHLYSTNLLSDLLNSIDDENRSTRICILRRLRPAADQKPAENRTHIYPQFSQIEIPLAQREDVLQRLSKYISDKDYTVRLEFVRSLGAFSGLSLKFICKLFDKKNIGLFIYGAEDEMLEVRRQLVLSIETFAQEGTLATVLDYLVDMLNDESETVRETVVSVLCRLSKKYKLEVNDEQVACIFSGLGEGNVYIKSGLLKLISNLYYSSTDIYFHLTTQDSLDTASVLKHLGLLILRNKELFMANLASIYSYDPFSENLLQSKTGKSSLYNIEYLAELVLLKNLSKHYELKIPKPVKKHFKFLKLKLFKDRTSGSDEMAERLCLLMLKILKGDFAYSDGIFHEFNGNQPAVAFLKQAYFALDAKLRADDAIPFMTLVHGFGAADEAFGLIETPGIPPFLENSYDVFNQQTLIKFLENLSKTQAYKSIVRHEFAVSVPSSVSVHRCPGPHSCAQFKAYLYYGHVADNIKFIVEDPSTTNKLVFALGEKVEVVIDECPPGIMCYIAVTYPDVSIKLSQTYRTEFTML